MMLVFILNSLDMCLNPRKIINPKRKFSQVGGHPLYMFVPCGKCAECQKNKVNEYLLRSYYESLDTFMSGGFVLFDTLTYDNAHVPYLSDFFDIPVQYDFMCFSYMDFRHFMVRLRERLSSEGYDVKDNLKYFCCSEYGTSENYSHRPHLHVKFYVSFDIDPFYFSQCVAECWTYGRTDGIPFQPRSYVLTKRLFSQKINPNIVHLQIIDSYVTKYIAKSSEYQKILDSRLDRYFSDTFGSNWRAVDENKELRSQMARYTSQFHKQSHGFGLSALKFNDISEVVKSGLMRMPDKDLVVRRIPIPTYYARKLFYTLTKDFRGKPQWQLTPEGSQMMLNKLTDSIKRLSFKFQDWYDTLHILCPDCCSSIRSRALEFLDDRNFDKFAEYILAYKGRVLPIDYFNKLRNDNSIVPPSLDYILPLSFEDGASVYLYNNHKEPIKIPSISTTWYGDKDNPLVVPKLPHIELLSKYVQSNIIGQQTFYAFRYFDDLFDLYVSSLYCRSYSKQSGFDLKQHLKDVYKCLQT